MKKLEVIEKICTDEMEKLDRIQTKIEKALKKAPEGSLIISNSNGSAQYYHKTPETGRRGRYIKKCEQKLIQSLAQKDYDLSLLREIEKRKKQLTGILKRIPKEDLGHVYQSLSFPRKELIQPHVLSDEDYIKEWLNIEYIGKHWIEEVPMIETERGEMVRSKSEKIIADKLFAMRIPYRYEYPLEVDGYGVIYPDFTLLKVSERKEIYFEHFGMMDDPEYCRKTILKLQTYARNHIYPGKNLLMTFETLRIPLDMRAVENMLQEIILS